MLSRYIIGIIVSICLVGRIFADQSVFIDTRCQESPRVQYARQRLIEALEDGRIKVSHKKENADLQIIVQEGGSLKKPEQYTLKKDVGRALYLDGSDDSGVLYGCLALIELLKKEGRLPEKMNVADGPVFSLRGPCIGMQKTYILEEYGEYNYPYTPELFPFFYDKKEWIRLLDRLADYRMNTLYLWNGHPFSSLVRLADYPDALDVSEETFQKNQEIFHFLTEEADRRGIWVVQMFYNIHISGNMAKQRGIPTHYDRPSPLLNDYTRQSIAAFVKNYPHVGLLVCLGEAQREEKNSWLRDVIIAGVREGMKEAGLKEEPPLIIREHTMDDEAPRIIRAGLEKYSNLYTMMKYNGESLTTEQPRGPWAELHCTLSDICPNHISNVHILANLEPFRYGATRFIQKCSQAIRDVHHCNGLHLYPLAYWDWPVSPDKAEPELRQLDRDWIWFAAWARYAWNPDRDVEQEDLYWQDQIAKRYGCSQKAAALILEAYNQAGQCAPKILRRFGITNGNRQTLSLGMTLDQLVRPQRYGLWPRLVDSDGPLGERPEEYVDKEWNKQAHEGETPVQILAEISTASQQAVDAIEAARPDVSKNREEFARLKNDMDCIQAMSRFYVFKVQAAMAVLRYEHSRNTDDLKVSVPYLEQSVRAYRELTRLTENTYRYANSLQTGARKIPLNGSGGQYNHWTLCLPVYELEYGRFCGKVEEISQGLQEQPQDAEDSGVEKKLGDIDWLLCDLIK